MKTAFGNAFLGMWLLALSFAIVGRFYRHISSEITTPIFYFCGFLTLGIGGFLIARMEGVALVRPTLFQASMLGMCGVLLGLGDYFSIKSFNVGGSVMTVATIIALVPCAAALIDVILGGELPAARTWAGWLFAAIAVVLIRGK